MNESYDHRKWLSFLQKAAALPMEFTERDFVWLQDVASVQYPALVPLINACLTIVRGNVEVFTPSERVTRHEHSFRSSASEAVVIRSYLDSKVIFPSNSNLIAFGRSRLPDFPDRRFDKMSRERIVRMLMDNISRAPESVANAILKDFAKIESGGGSVATTFLTDWESTIKSSR